MIRDKHVDVMLFWGILFVVMGHNYQLNWFFFPAYTFHMAFFFFISGYLFTIRETIKEKVSFFWKKIKKQLIPYFLINAVFGVITFLLLKNGIGVKGVNYRTDGELSIKNLFIEPFATGHQYPLNVAMWFLLGLFVVNIVAQSINWKDTAKAKITVFLISLPICLYLISLGSNGYKDFHLTFIRLGFGLLFFEMGMLIKQFKEPVLKVLKNPLTILGMWTIVALIKNYSGTLDSISYLIVLGDMKNKIFIIPLITTALIICISYAICYYISKIISNKSWVLKIGQNTFYIMLLHLSIFFIINFVFYKCGQITLDQLNTPYFGYNKSVLFPLYEILAILIPVLIGMKIDKMKPKLKKLGRMVIGEFVTVEK